MLLPSLFVLSVLLSCSGSAAGSPLSFLRPSWWRGGKAEAAAAAAAAAKASPPAPRLKEWPLSLGPRSFRPPAANGCGELRVNPASAADSGGRGEEGGQGESVCAEPDIQHTAGYYRLNRTHDARMFFMYFESRSGAKASAPLVLWMTGGPGCSGEVAVFFENGPFVINPDNTSLSWNPTGWDLVSNLLYVDQPVNTGFSYSHDPRDTRYDEEGVSQDMYDFMQVFLAAHPELEERPFFITGESYGGHYIPALAHRIYTSNLNKDGAHINLQGMAIGNGLTVPLTQFSSYPDFALLNNLISHDQFLDLRKHFTSCGIAARICGSKGVVSCYAAFLLCGSFWSQVLATSGSGNLNPYDIREDCLMPGLCYDLSAVDKFLAQEWVKEALGVPKGRVWQSCSSRVYMAMLFDFMRDLEPKVPALLEGGVRTLIYAGDKDFICNWLGNIRWVQQMEWSGQSAFLQATPRSFTYGAAQAKGGESLEAGPLSFLKVYNSGHMVPMNQPAASLEMLTRFLANSPLGDAPLKAASPFQHPRQFSRLGGVTGVKRTVHPARHTQPGGGAAMGMGTGVGRGKGAVGMWVSEGEDGGRRMRADMETLGPMGGGGGRIGTVVGVGGSGAESAGVIKMGSSEEERARVGGNGKEDEDEGGKSGAKMLEEREEGHREEEEEEHPHRHHHHHHHHHRHHHGHYRHHHEGKHPRKGKMERHGVKEAEEKERHLSIVGKWLDEEVGGKEEGEEEEEQEQQNGQHKKKHVLRKPEEDEEEDKEEGEERRHHHQHRHHHKEGGLKEQEEEDEEEEEDGGREHRDHHQHHHKQHGVKGVMGEEGEEDAEDVDEGESNGIERHHHRRHRGHKKGKVEGDKAEKEEEDESKEQKGAWGSLLTLVRGVMGQKGEGVRGDVVRGRRQRKQVKHGEGEEHDSEMD